MNPIFTVELDCKQTNSSKPRLRWLIKAALEIVIFCPQPGCEEAPVKQIREDIPKNAHRSLYRCQRCRHEFRPETSLAGRQLLEQEGCYLLDQRFLANASQEMVADELQVDQATISRLEGRLGEIAERLAPLLTEPESLSSPPTLTSQPSPSQVPVNYIDVTWKTIQSRPFNIIQVVNETGALQSVLFAEQRDLAFFQESIHLALKKRGPPELWVADGCPTTAQSLNQLKLPGLVVQHIHKKPFGRITLTHWTRSPTCECYVA